MLELISKFTNFFFFNILQHDSLNDSSIVIIESTPMKLDDNVTERKELKELHLSEILSLRAIDEADKENAGSFSN